MNIFALRTRVTNKILVLLALVSLILTSLPVGVLTAFAASTGVTVNNSALNAVVNSQVNFVVTASSDDTTFTSGTYIYVTDNGAGGNIFEGTIGGDCNSVAPDPDSHFSINENKGVCYNNPVAGVYSVTVQLRDAIDGNDIGSPTNVEVTVTEPPLDAFPSTNGTNKTNNYPHVNFVSDAPGSVTLEFISPTAVGAVFEYRIDGITPEGRPINDYTNPNHNPCTPANPTLPTSCGGLRYVANDETLYPGYYVANTTQTETFSANSTVEIRTIRGPERDYDFDWVTFNVPEPKDEEVEVVSGNTSAGENQPGWLFNRDLGTSNPYTFIDGVSVIGSGALYVTPIGSTPANKFIAEYFPSTTMGDVDSFSYDFNIGAGGAGSDANEFYLNVYTNFGDSANPNTNFYDCRYNVVPPTGVVGGWTTVTFDPTATYPVAKWGSSTSVHTCPASPAAMGDDAVIRAFAINLGDTSINDMGVDGYFDNVVFETSDLVKIYDFEPAPTAEVTICKVDQNDNKLSGWQLALLGDIVETHNVSSNGSVANSSVLTPDDYVVKSTGTYVYRSPNLPADARFSERLSTDAGYNDLPYKPWRVVNIGGLHIDGNNTLWGNVFNPNHDYYAPLTITSADSIALHIGDDSYGDNSGSLTATINKGYTGVTGEDGCVTFEDVTYGTYQVEELLQGGWINTDGLGGLVVDEEEVEHEVVNFDTTADPEMPVHLSPEDEAIQNVNDFYFEWTEVDGAVEYEFQSSQNPAVDENGVLTTGVWNNKANGNATQNYLTEPEIHSVGANGTWYWQVRAIDQYGNQSDWTETWMLTIDMVAPTAPEITAPTPEQIFASTPISNQWTVATDASGIENYQIAYAYDDEHTFGGSTCPDVTIDDKWVGCRDLTGTSRNHSPSLAEQGGVTIWVRAFDNAGNISDWSEPVHYYYYTSGTLPGDDAPAVPTGLAWTDSNSGSVSDGGTTDLESGTASWNANAEEDFSHYIYKYWNNIPSSPYNDESSAWTVNNGSSNSRGGSFNQGEGTHYFCIVAVDTADNESDCSEAFTVIYDTTDEGGGGEPEEDIIDPIVEITNLVVSNDKKLSFDLTATDESSGLEIVAANVYNETNTGSALVAIGSGSPTRLNVPHSGLPEETLLFATSTSDIDVSGLADGTYTIRAYARDHAGNEHRFLLVQFDITTSEGGGGGEDEDFGTLEVTKTVSGTIPEDVTGEFVITITCDNSEYDTTFTLTNGQSTSTDIADGVTCTVNEEDAQGATVTYTPDATVTMEEGETVAIEVTNTYAETIVETSGGGGGGSSSRRSNSAPEGEVLGASTSAGTCGMYLLEYMALGNASNSWEVMKLQLFLVSKGLVSATSGVFDLGTESSVKQYQADNSVAILDPWVTAGLATELAPTGNVYKTTRWHINNAVCPGSETFPVLP